MGAKLRQLLQARELYIRKMKHGKGYILLTPREKQALNEPDYLPSHTWHQRNLLACARVARIPALPRAVPRV